MRNLSIVLVAALLVLPACQSSNPDPVPRAPSPSSPAGVPGGPPPSFPGGPPPSFPGGPPPSFPGGPPPSFPGELPGELPHGERTLTGVVERSEGCTLLRVGSRLWALTGTPAGQLTEGATVTVAGQVTTGAVCGATRTLVVRRVI